MHYFFDKFPRDTENQAYVIIGVTDKRNFIFVEAETS